MTWLKIDDGLRDNRKIAAISDGAFRLHLYGLCYAARNASDGHIPADVLKDLRGTKGKVGELIAKGLWHERATPDCARCEQAIASSGILATASDGFLIHDFLDYNPRAVVVEAKRAAHRARMTALRDRRAHKVREHRELTG